MQMRYIIVLIFIISLSTNLYAQFKGDLEAKFLDDGRKIELTKDFSFFYLQNWDVPKGTVVDGASIPRILWTLIGGPFEGKYRKASVVHDYYCDTKSRRWYDVHYMFYKACLEEGLDEMTAKMMYTAVYIAGPRWSYYRHHGPSQQSADEPELVEFKTPTVTDKYIQEKLDWVKQNNPSVDKIKEVVTSEIDSEGNLRSQR